MARKFFFVWAWLFASCCAGSDTHAQTAVGTDGSGFIIMDNGDIYKGGAASASWSLCGSLFSGGGPVSRVIGMGEGVILTATGDYFHIGSAAGRPCFGVFDGHLAPPGGQSFVAIGCYDGYNGCYLYAVTDGGVVYGDAARCGGGWEYAGAFDRLPVLRARMTSVRQG
jgi:hypothetical protein